VTFNQKDIFPGAQPTKSIDLATLVTQMDASDDVPVTYSFGGGAPTALAINGPNGTSREILPGSLTGSISSKSGVNGYTGRMFVEYEPYAWDFLSPDYNGE
jgi:ABC-type hemin transport system ATPase subunit